MITGHEGHLCLCGAFTRIRCDEEGHFRNNKASSLLYIVMYYVCHPAPRSQGWQGCSARGCMEAQEREEESNKGGEKREYKDECERNGRQMSLRVSEWWGVWWDLICCLLSTVHTLCSECECGCWVQETKLCTAFCLSVVFFFFFFFSCSSVRHGCPSCQSQPPVTSQDDITARQQNFGRWARANYFDYVILIVLQWDRLFLNLSCETVPEHAEESHPAAAAAVLTGKVWHVVTALPGVRREDGDHPHVCTPSMKIWANSA